MNTSKFDFDGMILIAMKLKSVVQIKMKLSSKGVPSFKVIGENIEEVEAVVDATKSYYATDKPKQRLSFKIHSK